MSWPSSGECAISSSLSWSSLEGFKLMVLRRARI